MFSYGEGSPTEKLETARLYVDAINRSLDGIPRDRVRLHTCYGINEGPRVHDAELGELIETVFTIEAGAFSFEAANPRHEHAYHVFETVKLPPDTVLPGVISHTPPPTSSSTVAVERSIAPMPQPPGGRRSRSDPRSPRCRVPASTQRAQP